MSGPGIDANPAAMDADDVTNVNNVNIDDLGDDLQTPVKVLVAQRLESLKNRGIVEVQQLKDRQARIRLMHSLLRAINQYSDEKGIDFNKHPEFAKIREQAKAMLAQGKELMAEAEELEKQGKMEEAKVKKEEASELIEVAKALGAESDKTVYTKDEKDKLVETLRTACEDLNTVNQLQSQTVSRLNNELHECLLIGRDILKRIHEILSSMARSIRGS